jgi:hypothetical protein
MQIDDAVETLVVILHVDPLTQSAHIVTDTQLTGGLGATEDYGSAHNIFLPLFFHQQQIG